MTKARTAVACVVAVTLFAAAPLSASAFSLAAVAAAPVSWWSGLTDYLGSAWAPFFAIAPAPVPVQPRFAIATTSTPVIPPVAPVASSTVVNQYLTTVRSSGVTSADLEALESRLTARIFAIPRGGIADVRPSMVSLTELRNVTTIASAAGSFETLSVTGSDPVALNGPLALASRVPASTPNTLYNSSGDLYWAGNLVSGAAVGVWTSDGSHVWRPTGNVGIGTTSPYATLSVAGSGVFDGNLTATNITATGTLAVSGAISAGDSVTLSNGINGGIYHSIYRSGVNWITDASNYAGSGVGTRIISGDDGNFGSFLSFSTRSTTAGGSLAERARFSNQGNFLIGSATDDASGAKLQITGNANISGNVGIGTTSPYKKLSVEGDVVGTNISATNWLSGAGVFVSDGYANGSMYVTDSNGGRQFTLHSYRPGIGEGKVEFDAAVWRYYYQYGLGMSTPTITLNSQTGTITSVGNGIFSGNVGIGNTNPSEKLEVEGNIHAHGVVSWHGGDNNQFGKVGNAGVIANNGDWYASSIFASQYGQNLTGVRVNWGGGVTTVRNGVDQNTLDDGSGKAYFSGNVGIGTTSPGAKLAINGDLLFDGTANRTISVDNAGTGGDGKNLILRSGDAGHVSGGHGGDIVLWPGLKWGAQWSEGGVGIYTDNPSGALEVVGNTVVSGIAQGAQTGLNVQWNSTYRSLITEMGYTIFNNNFTMNAANGSLTFSTLSSPRLTVLSDGNVGVGTTNPSARFAVKGSGTGNAFQVANSSDVTKFAVQENGDIIIGSSPAFGANQLDYTIKVANNSGGDNFGGGSLTIAGPSGSWSSTMGGDLILKGGNTSTGSPWSSGNVKIMAGYNTQNATTDSNIIFYGGQAQTEQARLNVSGSFGIGTTSPWAKLAVNPVAGDGNSFVIGSSTATNFVVTNGGNVGIGTADPSLGPLTMGSGAYVTSGGTWTNASSRSIKENFAQVDKQDILTKIQKLDITKWNYKKESSDVTHIGPVAEDFFAAFGLGGSASSISTIDPAGVALVGIQALAERLDALEARIGTTTLTVADTATSTLDFSSSSFLAILAEAASSTRSWVGKNIAAATGWFGSLRANEVSTEKLCVGSVCIGEAELKTLLEKGSVNPIVISDPTPTATSTPPIGPTPTETATSTPAASPTPTEISLPSPSATPSPSVVPSDSPSPTPESPAPADIQPSAAEVAPAL